MLHHEILRTIIFPHQIGVPNAKVAHVSVPWVKWFEHKWKGFAFMIVYLHSWIWCLAFPKTKSPNGIPSRKWIKASHGKAMDSGHGLSFPKMTMALGRLRPPTPRRFPPPSPLQPLLRLLPRAIEAWPDWREVHMADMTSGFMINTHWLYNHHEHELNKFSKLY